MSLTPQESMLNEIFTRLEGKVDDLTEAVLRLVVVEERQTAQGARIGGLEQVVAALNSKMEQSSVSQTSAINALDMKVERWINRGIGVWGVVAVLFAVTNSQVFSAFALRQASPAPAPAVAPHPAAPRPAAEPPALGEYFRPRATPPRLATFTTLAQRRGSTYNASTI